MFKNGITEEQIIAGMRDDFLEDASHRLSLLRKNLDAARAKDCDNDPFEIFRAELHTLKGMGQAFGFPSLTLISRRLEGYLEFHTEESFAADGGIEPYLDRIQDVVVSGQEPDDERLQEMLDSLPMPASHPPSDIRAQ